MSTLPSCTDQHLNITSAGNYVCSIGTANGSKSLCIGPGQQIDANITGAAGILELKTTGEVYVRRDLHANGTLISAATTNESDHFHVKYSALDYWDIKSISGNNFRIVPNGSTTEYFGADGSSSRRAPITLIRAALPSRSQVIEPVPVVRAAWCS